MPINKGDEYTCRVCRGTFKTNWSEAEALAEMSETFGVSAGNADVVCDDCYRKVMKRLDSILGRPGHAE